MATCPVLTAQVHGQLSVCFLSSRTCLAWDRRPDLRPWILICAEERERKEKEKGKRGERLATGALTLLPRRGKMSSKTLRLPSII